MYVLFCTCYKFCMGVVKRLFLHDDLSLGGERKVQGHYLSLKLLFNLERT